MAKECKKCKSHVNKLVHGVCLNCAKQLISEKGSEVAPYDQHKSALNGALLKKILAYNAENKVYYTVEISK